MTEQDLRDAADCLYRLAAVAEAGGFTARATALQLLAEDCEAELMLTHIATGAPA